MADGIREGLVRILEHAITLAGAGGTDPASLSLVALRDGLLELQVAAQRLGRAARNEDERLQVNGLRSLLLGLEAGVYRSLAAQDEPGQWNGFNAWLAALLTFRDKLVEAERSRSSPVDEAADLRVN